MTEIEFVVTVREKKENIGLNMLFTFDPDKCRDTEGMAKLQRDIFNSIQRLVMPYMLAKGGLIQMPEHMQAGLSEAEQKLAEQQKDGPSADSVSMS